MSNRVHVGHFDDHCVTADLLKLGRAYETLKNKIDRRKYDLIYPSLKNKTASFQPERGPSTPTVPTSTATERAQIAALHKSKQERAQRWWTSKKAFDASIFEAERVIRRLEKEINGLTTILAAEAAEEAQKNSWSTWILSPIFKKVEESDEVKAQKDRARQERRIEKDMKERRLLGKRAELKTIKDSMEILKIEIDAADRRDDVKIQELKSNIWRKESWQRQEMERAEREKRAQRLWQQQQEQEQRQRQAAEASRQREAAARLARQQREEEEARKWQKIVEEFTKQQEEQSRPREYPYSFTTTEHSPHQTSSASCIHDGWWPKVQGRASCPACHDIWTYLLQCPGCAMKACPKCQAAVRPRRPRNTPKTGRRAHPRPRSPSPGYGYDYDW